MATKGSKQIVIDASVARSAGESVHVVSKACRSFLEEVKLVCHRLVMTPDIRDEWKRHRSRFSATWLSSMTARKKVVRLVAIRNDALRTAIANLQITTKQRAAIMKDLPLVEAALASDLTIASRDDEAHTLLRRAAGEIGLIRGVVWVNPVKEDEGVLWLRAGALASEEKRLGYAVN